MINKKFLLIFVLLVTFNGAFALQGDPKVFQVSYDNRKMACAEIDEKYATCWEPAAEGFLTLEINQSEKQRLQRAICSPGDACLLDLEKATPYALALIDLVVQVLDQPPEKQDAREKMQREIQQELQQNIYDTGSHSTTVSKLNDLFVQRILAYSKDRPKNTRNCVARIRALGAAIYMNYGHDGMMMICNTLPTLWGIRRTLDSLWGGIGRWLR